MAQTINVEPICDTTLTNRTDALPPQQQIKRRKNWSLLRGVHVHLKRIVSLDYITNRLPDGIFICDNNAIFI